MEKFVIMVTKDGEIRRPCLKQKRTMKNLEKEMELQCKKKEDKKLLEMTEEQCRIIICRSQ